MIIFQSLTRQELEDLLVPVSRLRKGRPHLLSPEERAVKERKQARYRSKQIFHWVYQRHIWNWDDMTDLSKDLRVWLKENVEIYQPDCVARNQSEDGTAKVLWKMDGGKTVESVVIPAFKQDDKPRNQFAGSANERSLDSEEWSRLTICISSQVGCAMACKFCLTGVQGLDRHLAVHEIVSQVQLLRKEVPISNIVFMGMGEPLHNFDSIAKACQIFLDADGLAFSRRKVTVSTSGLVPAIDKLAATVPVMLAVSLNATTDEQRDHIMPVNKKWNIEKLLDACRRYYPHGHRRITFEYVLLKDFNDSLEDAARLHQLVKGIPSKVNLIPFNEHIGSPFERPSDKKVREFHQYLLDRHLTATVRISRGRDILAACGQLRSLFDTARGTDRHKDYQPEIVANP